MSLFNNISLKLKITIYIILIMITVLLIISYIGFKTESNIRKASEKTIKSLFSVEIEHSEKVLTQILKQKGVGLSEFISNIAGYRIVAFDFDTVSKYLDDIVKDNDVVYAFLNIEPDGNIIYRVDKTFLQDKADINKDFKELINRLKESGIFEFSKPVTYNSVKVATFTIGISKKNLLKSRKKALNHLQNAETTLSTQIADQFKKIGIVIFVISLFALIIVAVLIYMLINTLILNRIHKVCNIMEKVSEGDLSLKILHNNQDEMDELCESFNIMLNRIAKQIETLGEMESASKNISSSMNHSKMLKFGIDSIRDLINTSIGVIYLIDNEKNTIKTIATSGNKKYYIPNLYYNEGLLSNIVKECKTNSIDDFNNDSNISSSDKQMFKCKSLLCVPLLDKSVVVGFMVLMENDEIHKFSLEEIYIAETLSTSISIQLKNIGLLAEVADKARMDLELKTAKAVQRALFPNENPELKSLEIATFFRSATETGGDWYGFITKDSRYHYVLIGDVTGHGAPAALVTAAVRGSCLTIESLIKYYNLGNLEPNEILEYINRTVYMTGKQKWVMTFFIGRFDLQTGEFLYSNAAHNFPMLLQSKTKPKPKVISLGHPGARLGFNIKSKFKQERKKLEQDDVVLFYTDGLIECENHNGKQYGKRMIKNILMKNYSDTAENIKNMIIHDALNFTEGYPINDDVSVIVLKVKNQNDIIKTK